MIGKLINYIKSKHFHKDEKCEVNHYRCRSCGKVIKATDIHPGTTPFMIECFNCNQFSCSTFYQNYNGIVHKEIEFYRPSFISAIFKHYKDINYICNGGLISRKPKKK